MDRAYVDFTRLHVLHQAGGAFLQVDQAVSSYQAVPWHVGKRGEDTDLERRLGLRPGRHRQEAPRPGRFALHFAPDPLRHPLRKKCHSIKRLPETKTDIITRK